MCPLGADQTERSPQRFFMLAPMLRKGIQDLERIDRYYLFDLLRSKLFSHSSNGHFSTASEIHALSVKSSKPSLLERLPAELLDHVFCCQELERRDMMALGLSSSHLWQHFLRNCAGKSDVGSLSGTPLFSIGNYLRDFPASMRELFPSEVKELESRPRGRYGRIPAREWLKEEVYRSDWLLAKGAVDSWKFTLSSIKDHGLDGVVLQKLESTLQPVLHEGIGEAGRKWYLRNLRTKEFVRLEASPEPDEPEQVIRRPGKVNTSKVSNIDDTKTTGHGGTSRAIVATVVSAPWLSLDSGLLFMTLYPKYRDDDDQEPKEAEWVGHEFDIVSEEQWQSLEHGEWTEATERMKAASRRDRKGVLADRYNFDYD